jgi:endoglucanase
MGRRATASNRLLACALLVATVVLLVGLAAVRELRLQRPAQLDGGSTAIADQQAVKSAEAFLEAYVDEDGRVVRRDQGGDTVSEGQAYAMLIAVALEDHDRFDAVWRWTQQKLQRPDGLLSFLWRDGEVADPEPAADADLDAARALLLAASRFEEEAYRHDARRIAGAIAEKETARSDGRTVLVAGPWALRTDRIILNPSYFAPRTFSLVARATGDAVWQAWESRAGAR